jgi:hypothetical protein
MQRQEFAIELVMSTANWERRIGSFLVFLCMPMASLPLCIGTTLPATIPQELSSRHGREMNNGVYLIIQSPDLACYVFLFIFTTHDTHPYSPYPAHMTCMHLNGAAIVGLYAYPNCMLEGLALIANWCPMTPQIEETFLTCKSHRRKRFRSNARHRITTEFSSLTCTRPIVIATVPVLGIWTGWCCRE